MRIILLSGKPKTGKTTTLNIVYDFIKQDGGKIINEKERLRSINDFKCVFLYNKKKVAIFNMGDFLKECIKALIEYSNQDVLVLAYSDIFIKLNLKEITKKFSYHCVIEKTVAEKNEHSIANDKDCKRIISELKSI